jgi:hypothetical protein
VEVEEQSEKRTLWYVAQIEQEEAEELHFDLHASTGHLTS